MKKIVIVGAGGVIFTQNIVKDLLLNETTRHCRFCLMDIDAGRLSRAEKVLKKLAEQMKLPFAPETTVSLREALKDADYVITIFRCGTLEHQKLEYQIPAKYGVKHVVGDSLNPGGIFRGLRTLKALFEVLDAMEEICPDAYLLNYVNPMSMNTIALCHRAKKVRVIGLCHSVQHTSREIAKWLNVPYEKLNYYAAGVNHQAFMLKLEMDGRDLYPELRRCLDKPEIYHTEKVRFEILRNFGYFPTESSGHGSEYVPYFRKRADLLEKFCSVTAEIKPEEDLDKWSAVSAGMPGASLETCRLLQIKNEKESEQYLHGEKQFELKKSNEYAPEIIIAMETNTPLQANLNVMNRGLIPSLPPESCVEVPCLVTGAGVFPARIENYPEHLAALNRGMINVQILGAQGALSGRREDIFHAAAADPLTAAVCSLDEIRAMVDEMFEALKDQIDPRFSA